MYLCFKHFKDHYHLCIEEDNVICAPEFCELCGKEVPCVVVIKDYKRISLDSTTTSTDHQCIPPQST